LCNSKGKFCEQRSNMFRLNYLLICNLAKDCIKKYVRFMKKAVFWDVAPCRYGVNRRFGGTYRL
jgi:hypothetical protein